METRGSLKKKQKQKKASNKFFFKKETFLMEKIKIKNKMRNEEMIN